MNAWPAGACRRPGKTRRAPSRIFASLGGSAWLRPRIAPLAIMVAAVAGALSGRVFRLPGGIIPPARSSRWRIVERRAFEEARRIVGVGPCGRGEDKGDKASADKHRSPPWGQISQGGKIVCHLRRHPCATCATCCDAICGATPYSLALWVGAAKKISLGCAHKVAQNTQNASSQGPEHQAQTAKQMRILL
jgi:hypothetical protein